MCCAVCACVFSCDECVNCTSMHDRRTYKIIYCVYSINDTFIEFSPLSFSRLWLAFALRRVGGILIFELKSGQFTLSVFFGNDDRRRDWMGPESGR